MPDNLPNVGLVTPQRTGVEMNPNAAAAPGKALANVGKAIGAVGDTAFGVSQRMQEAKNAGLLAEGRRIMREGKAEFDRDISKQEVDESQWGEHWTKKVDSIESQLNEMELGPAARRDMELQLLEFKSRAAVDVQDRATAQGLDRAKSRHVMSAEQAMNGGDIDTAEAEIDAIPGVLPEWKEGVKLKLRERHDYNSLENEAYMDPAAVIEKAATGQLPSHLSTSDQRRIVKIAENQDLTRRADESDYINERIANQDIKTEADIDRELEESVYLDDKDKATLKKNFISQTPLNDKEMSGYRERIINLRKGATELPPERYEQEYLKLVKELSLEGRRIGSRDLREELGASSPDSMRQLDQARKKSHSDRMREAGQDTVQDLLSARPDKDTLHSVRGTVDRGLDAWLQSHPSPDTLTVDDVQAKAKELWQNGINGKPIDQIVWENTASGSLLPPK